MTKHHGRPQQWWLPKTERAVFSGHLCRHCGHVLPDFEFVHLFGPWDANLEEALKGAANLAACASCKAVYPFDAPVLICAPEANRLLFVRDAGFTIPEVARVDGLLEALLVARCGAGSPFLLLARQFCHTSSDLNGLLSVPDEFVHQDRRAGDERVARLPLAPRRKAALLKAQVIALVDETVQGFAREHPHIEGETEPVEIGLLHIATAFEVTSAGLASMREGLRPGPGEDRYQPILEQLLAMLEAKGAQPVREEPRYRERLQKDDLEAVDSLPSVASLSERPRRYECKMAWLLVMRRLFRSGHTALALDITEAYIRSGITLPEFDSIDIEAIVFFGSLVQRAAGVGRSFGGAFAYPYFQMAVGLLPPDRIEADPALMFLAAFAREGLGDELEYRGELTEALGCFMEALELYRLVGRDDGVATVTSRAAPIAVALKDEAALARLRENEASWFSSTQTNGQLNSLWGAVERASDAGEKGQVRLAKMTYVFVSRVDDPWPEHEIRTNLTPLNFNPNDPESMPDNPTADAEIIRKFEPEVWRRFLQARERAQAEVVIGRVVHVGPEGSHIAAEVIVQHPILDWVASGGANADFESRRLTGMGELWVWAAKNELLVWLGSQWEHLRDGELDIARDLDRRRRILLGRAFCTVALAGDGSDAERRAWFAQIGIELLDPIFGAKPAAKGTMSGVSPQGAFQLRSDLARVLEMVGRLDDAALVFEDNLWRGFLVRHHTPDGEQRRAVQELVGVAASRLNRTRIRKSGFPLAPAVAREIFETIERTRARVLLDALQSNGCGVQLAGQAQSGLEAAYLQFSIAQSAPHFEGSWVAAELASVGSLHVRPVAWEEPLACHKQLQLCLDAEVVLRDVALGRDDMVAAITRILGWVEGEDLFRSATASRPLHLSSCLYLMQFPWSFLGVARAHLSPPQFARQEVAVVAAFSLATAILAERPRAYRDRRRIRLFIDPMGDLPEVIAALATADQCFETEDVAVHIGIAASAATFRASVLDADLLVFVGHGEERADHAGARLLFSMLGRIGEETLAPLQPGADDAHPRVAIIIACWSASLEVNNAFSSWEPNGLVYALRRLGFDYVVSALWPISPRMGGLFAQVMLVTLRDRVPVPEAFLKAYQSLIATFGIEAVVAEAPCIQLNA